MGQKSSLLEDYFPQIHPFIKNCRCVIIPIPYPNFEDAFDEVLAEFNFKLPFGAAPHSDS